MSVESYIGLSLSNFDLDLFEATEELLGLDMSVAIEWFVASEGFAHATIDFDISHLISYLYVN